MNSDHDVSDGDEDIVSPIGSDIVEDTLSHGIWQGNRVFFFITFSCTNVLIYLKSIH
jgi:hypothetical protein